MIWCMAHGFVCVMWQGKVTRATRQGVQLQYVLMLTGCLVTTRERSCWWICLWIPCDCKQPLPTANMVGDLACVCMRMQTSKGSCTAGLRQVG